MVLERPRRPEQVGHGGGEQQRGMQRAASGAGVIDDRPVRVFGEEQGQCRRHGHDERSDGNGRRDRENSRAEPAAAVIAVDPPCEHETGEDQDAEIGHLIAAGRHAARDEAGSNAISERAPLQRARQQPNGDRQVGEAEDLPDMLDAPGGGAAEGEGQRGHDRPGRMPSAVAKEQDDGEAAEAEHAEHDPVRRLESGIGIDEGEDQEGRREDQRLRIGDLRRAGEDERRPERLLAAGERLRHELQLRIEMRLGVPRDRDGAGQPRPAQGEPGGGEQAERPAERPALISLCGRVGWSVGPRVLADLGRQPRPPTQLLGIDHVHAF